ncbi:MAG: hypothetical protein R3B57_11145 [Phycisphaerales bacterium]
MSPAPLEPHDLALLRRFRDGMLEPDPRHADLLTRALWIHAHLWDSPTAARQLARTTAAAHEGARHTIERFFALVRAAHDADFTPARCSSEFLWRHPELAALLARELERTPPTPP